jgi:hypothetical protein
VGRNRYAGVAARDQRVFDHGARDDVHAIDAPGVRLAMRQASDLAQHFRWSVARCRDSSRSVAYDLMASSDRTKAQPGAGGVDVAKLFISHSTDDDAIVRPPAGAR